MPEKPDELKHAWLRALHRDDIDELKVVYVCSKHFREGDKDDELLYQAVSLSLEAEVEENEKFRIQNLHDLQAKLHFISIANIWSTWCPDEYTLIFLRPRIDSSKIQVNTYLSIEFDLSLKAYHNGNISNFFCNFM